MKRRTKRQLKATLTLIVGLAVWAEELAKSLAKGSPQPQKR